MLRYVDFSLWTHGVAVYRASFSTFARGMDRQFRRQIRRYLARLLRGRAFADLATLERIREALAEALPSSSAAYVGDKYPDYILLYPQFVHQPHTKCVFICRDALDVVASIHHRIHTGAWRGRRWTRRCDTIDKATDYWLSVMQALHDLKRLDTNALIIRYEDLVLHTAATVPRIAAHLDLQAEGFDASLPNSSSIGRYRDRLSPGQVDAIVRRAGAVMEDWGYRQ